MLVAMPTAYLVRHGETAGESSVRYHGSNDVPLSAVGRQQVRRLVPVLRPKDLIDPLWVAFVTAIAASIWPAVRAARIRPAEAARHV